MLSDITYYVIYMEKIDLRIIKTKKSIYDAFISLMSEKTFEEIKVSEICERALINRSTFYSHFDDKFTLFDSLISDMKNSLLGELNKKKITNDTKEYYMDLIRILLDEIDKNKDVYVASLINNRNSIAMDMIYTTLKEDLKEKTKNYKEGVIPNEFLASFYIGGIYIACMEWIKGGFKYSKDDIIEYIDKLIDEKLINIGE